MWEPTAWAIGGGAEHTPEVARALAYAATSGGEGVVEPSSCKVTALPTPGSSVRIAPGAVLIRNRYAGGDQQTYTARNRQSHNKAITPTGGSPRADLVIARIHDPQYGGEVPADPTDYQYVTTEIISGVPSGTETAAELNLGYPAIALARIVIPANTSTITNAMIQDLRKVAQPRSLRRMFPIYGTGNKNTTGHLIPTSGYSSWPIRPEQRPTIWVPEWATHLTIVGHYSGVYFHRGASTDDTVAGIRTGFGTGAGENGILIEDVDQEGGRKHYVVVGDHEVSPDRRGSFQQINLQATRTAGSGSWWADYQTSIMIDVEFTERAV